MSLFRNHEHNTHTALQSIGLNQPSGVKHHPSYQVINYKVHFFSTLVISFDLAIMSDLIRGAPLGQALRWMSRNRLFQYPEEAADFELPVQYTTQLNSEDYVRSQPSNPATLSTVFTRIPSSTDEKEIESLGISKTKSRAETMPYSNERYEVD
jgi:hypothetical protein